MPKYSAVAWERAMKVQEVILRAMAKKITWWQAAEIIGLSDRSMRRWRQRYEEHGYDGLLDRRRGKPSPKRCSPGAGGRGAAAVSGEVRGPERAALSREAAGSARHRVELYVGEAGAARGGAGEERAEAGRTPQAAGAPAAAGDAACTWTAAGTSGFRTSVGMT